MTSATELRMRAAAILTEGGLDELVRMLTELQSDDGLSPVLTADVDRMLLLAIEAAEGLRSERELLKLIAREIPEETTSSGASTDWEPIIVVNVSSGAEGSSMLTGSDADKADFTATAVLA